MAIVDKTKLKGYFERGDRPNQSQFEDLIDSMYGKADDHDFTANTIVSTGGTTILTCKEDGGHMGTLYVDTLFVAGGEYDPGSDVPSMYGYKYDPSKPSFAELENNINTASGGYSHAEGFGSIAAGLGAHAEGGYNASNPGGWATGTSSHAEGVLTTASTPCSHAEGYKTYACGNEAHTEGDQTIAYSHAAHAEGSGSTASGESAHAEGHACVAKGYGAHAEGDSTSGLATGAHSEGYYTLAKSNYSHAGGSNTTAQTNASFVHGSNIAGSKNCVAHAAFGTNGNIAARESSLSKAVRFAVCNGTSTSALKDAFEVFSDGSVSFNESQLFTGVTTTVSSASTDNQLPTAKACWNAISGNGLTKESADSLYLTKRSTEASKVTASWSGSGLVIQGATTSGQLHGLKVLGGGGETYIHNGEILTTSNVNASGNTNIKGNLSVTGNTTVSGNTKLKAVSGTVNSCENVKLGVPIGSIVAWPGCGCPDGWKQCNGDAVTSVTLTTSIGSDTSSYYYVKILTGGTQSTQRTDRYIKISKSYSKQTLELLLVLMGSNIGTLHDSHYFWAYYYNASFQGRIWPTSGAMSGGWGQTRTVNLPNLKGRFILGRENAFGTTGGESTHKLTEAEMPSHRHYLTKNVVYRDTGTQAGKAICSSTGCDVLYEASADYTNYVGSSNAHNNMPPYMEMDWIIKVS